MKILLLTSILLFAIMHCKTQKYHVFMLVQFLHENSISRKNEIYVDFKALYQVSL